jgi:poly(3-hydroxybutyrate) depolymerase
MGMPLYTPYRMHHGNCSGRTTMTRITGRILACGLALACIAWPAARAADALPALHADPSRTSVSGLSSGAFMTVQYGVAFSSSVIGLGVVAGGPYNCAYVNFGGISSCMSGQPSGSLSWAAAQGFAALGQIDPVEGLSKLRIYLFSGTRDEVVHPPVVAATRDFFRAAGVPAKNLAFVDKMPAGHAFIAPSFGNACAANATPYIDQCSVKKHESESYDQPGALFQQIYGHLNAPADALSATVQPFDQREFANAATSLDSIGFVYIPKNCQADAGRCAVHVVFHGCKQGRQSVGSDVFESVGYNRWADTNQLIVLYPQAVTSQAFPSNPEGCWDWWGYTGPTFQVRSGVQLAAVKAMVDRLTGAK